MCGTYEVLVTKSSNTSPDHQATDNNGSVPNHRPDVRTNGSAPHNHPEPIVSLDQYALSHSHVFFLNTWEPADAHFIYSLCEYNHFFF